MIRRRAGDITIVPVLATWPIGKHLIIAAPSAAVILSREVPGLLPPHRGMDSPVKVMRAACSRASRTHTKRCGLKNAPEAGRQSSHTAARPISHVSMGTITPSTVAPNTEWITEYTWPPTAKWAR